MLDVLCHIDSQGHFHGENKFGHIQSKTRTSLDFFSVLDDQIYEMRCLIVAVG